MGDTKEGLPGFVLKRRKCEFCGKKRLCRANRVTGWMYYCEPCHKHFDGFKKPEGK